MEDNQKPPTQSVGVAGFKADLYANDQIKIHWHNLIGLPKFQMYATQMSGNSYGDIGNVMEWIMGYVQDRIQSYGEQNFFDEYVKWHSEKGYWNNEDVYGALIKQ
ncbi:hypothetical protein C3F34_14080 [Acinetobacter sp. ACNIH2]|uniref:hypothetical protein n=1 Tax=Acinetobacter sp. ACNIH2 TaxID=1758189 RepID=UPI000CDCAA25|nr:hypothetical protein [Acinetobacter sp. ACNIH2]AUX87051.1 hypothetical protein C3F34_14080 [Acinetobacter sp. ACNIH2]